MAEPEAVVPTWTEVVSRGTNRLLLVPVGSFEQHGPHLPLDTDTRLATALVDEMADLACVVTAPPLPYGASGEHAGFAGTLSIGSEVLADVLVELVRSARGSFAGVVLVSTHGGNTEALGRVTERCEFEGDRVFVWRARVDGGDAHAGRTETSLMLAIAPDAVRRGEIQPGRIDPLEHLWPDLRLNGVQAVSATGVLGDPTLATAAEGRRLFASWVEELRESIESWWSDLSSPAVAGPIR